MTGAALTTEQKARPHADEAEPCAKKGQRRNEICRLRTPLAVNHEMIARLDDYERRRGSREKAAPSLSQINAIKRRCLIVITYYLSGGARSRRLHYKGGTDLSPEVTMSHWRRLHEPAPQHSYLADWVIAATVVLALVLIAHG